MVRATHRLRPVLTTTCSYPNSQLLFFESTDKRGEFPGDAIGLLGLQRW
jgi:hypothetical protein